MDNTMSLEELRTAMISAVSQLIESKKNAGVATELSPEVKAALEAAGMKATPISKVNPAVAAANRDAADFLKMGIIQCRVSDRQERPDDEKATFINELADNNTQDAAFAMMVKKLEGVPKDKYKLNSYDPVTGKFKAAAFDPNEGKFVGLGEQKGGYAYPGSLADKIKVTIKGGRHADEIVVAS
jgi:hypothetical protein